MGRPCSICTHPQRDEIDRLLVEGKEPLRIIAERYGTTPSALCRHKRHIPSMLAKAHEAGEVARADDLLSQVRDLQARALAILEQAEQAGDLRTALGAIREARGNLELLAKMIGELQAPPTVIVASPEWVALRTEILVALEPYPEARLSVARALESAEG